MRGMQGIITLDGFELQYHIEGEGTPVVIVGSALYYSRLFAPFSPQAHVQLVYIDHRGFARPPASYIPEDYTFERIVDDIETVRQHLELKDIVILGHSGHAFLALEYARKYPNHVQKVVLLNTAPTNSRKRQEQSDDFFLETAQPERKKRFEQDVALLHDDIARDPDRRFAHLLIRTSAKSFYDYAFDATPLWEGVITNMPIIDYLWSEAFAQIDMRPQLIPFEKSVFLGLGIYDYLVGPVTLWDGIEHEASHVTKVIFDHSGHNPMFEEPALFQRRLIDWIQRS